MQIDISVLKRYFSDKYSRKDFLLIREHIEDNDKDLEMKSLMLEHWNELDTGSFSDVNLDNILNKIHHQVHLEENREFKKFNIWRSFQRIAAIMMIPLVMSFLIYHFLSRSESTVDEGYAEIQCPLGVRTKFQLPDGTRGYLNSGSTLRYSLAFRNSRQVNLVGEAYFEVATIKNSLFNVQTRNLNIDVLGTIFNVIAYPEEETEEVIFQQGSLYIRRIDDNNIFKLMPDQKLEIDSQTKLINKYDVIASNYSSWKDGKLVFRNEQMDQVAKRLSRWYNAEIIIADEKLNDYSFYATFQDEQLDEVLKLLALTTPILYEEEKREILTDGLYLKRKITLKLNPDKINQFK